MSSKSRFDFFNSILRKYRRWIILAWFVVLAISLIFVPSFFSSVSYNVTGGIGGPTNTESQKAANILNTQFPGSNNGSNTSILIVFQGSHVYSDQVKKSVLDLNSSLAQNGVVSQNYTGMNAVYTIETGFLNKTLSSLLTQTANLQSNISKINSGLYTLKDNLSTLSSSIFQLQTGINQTAQLVYGIPSGFVQVWEGVVAHGITDPYLANEQANATFFQATNGFGGNNESIAYYSVFYTVWNSSFQRLPNSTTPIQREAFSLNQSVAVLHSSPAVNAQTKQIISTVSTGLNVTNWNNPEAVANLTITTIAKSIPSQITTALGVSPARLVSGLYQLGPSPSDTALGNYTVSLFESNLPKNSTSTASGLSASQLVNSSYNLGPSPSQNETWSLASSFIANATHSLFANSPIFSVNATSLSKLLENLPKNATSDQIKTTINSVVANESYDDFPFVPSRSITKNLVSSDNGTMIVILNFSSQPSHEVIQEVQKEVDSSGLSSLGKTYVTGSSVLSQDVQDAFTPALSITIGPGVVISILIVGLLFLSPVAALIPIILGGISIAIALPVIYFGIVVLGKGNITFLTPTLTILLVLGLAVDYAVLQLRRTREERINGRTTEESVGISVRWAGQAVLTAGITVIVAYVVMAVAHVPLFSDVGTAIAIAVAILLALSMTLLPSLEIALGDRLFWPGLSRQIRAKRAVGTGETRLERVAEGTLKRKIVIASVISVVALAAVYTTYNTPVGADFLKLIPNFPSNQGLTVITTSLGSGTIAPATIIVTTPTPIVYGHNQFNQTLLNQIEHISNAAGNSSGVVSVTGPTRPFGSVFNYSTIQNTSEPLKLQYQGGVLSTIGKDNKTALITVGLSNSSESQAAINSLLGMEKNVQKLSLYPGETIYFGGDTQSTYDNQTFLDGLLPQVIIILAVAVYIILLAQLRSAFTPLRLIFTILCSVAFSLAILSLIFYHALDLPILDFVPLFVVVTMLGVGIDYDIFFVTRIREEVLNGKTDNEAIKIAVDRVWVTILGLGLVLSTVFGSLLITGIAIFQEISLAVAGAILVDVVVIILFFVPSLMGLAQRANWWPSKIRRTNQPAEH